AAGHLVHTGDRRRRSRGDPTSADPHPGPARAHHRHRSGGRMTARLDPAVLAELDGMLAGTDADSGRLYPGERWTRQPVHTVYIPADQFAADTAPRWGRAAQVALDQHAPDPAALAAATGMPAAAV